MVMASRSMARQIVARLAEVPSACCNSANVRSRCYSCQAYWKRGSTVCANGLSLRLDTIDRAVLATITDDVLRPEIVAAIIAGVEQALRPDPAGDAVAAAELTSLDGEIARLTEAIAMGGELQTLVAAQHGREARRAEILAARRPWAQAVPLNRRTLERTTREKLDDWRALLTRNVQDARQLLWQVLVGPLVFTPKNGAYRFKGEAAIGMLLGTAGVPCVSGVPEANERPV